ncbi:hypothetical protein [Zavarzinella formosa]|uniref:hypothetical protein n=1 Tax=Zavarzinella formosa TaxID=360055 RepID=UPI0002DCB095|nr:hypothetical protein [Zavarzinella formosa]
MKTANRPAMLPLVFVLLFAGSGCTQETAEKLLDEFTDSTDTDKTVFTREGNGLLINAKSPLLPFLPGQRTQSFTQLLSTFAVGGDFEFFVDFDVRQLAKDPKKITAEANAEIAMTGRGYHNGIGINVTSIPDSGTCFRVVRTNPKRDGGKHYNIVAFPRKFQTGRIGIRRQGADVILLAADGPDAQPVELVRYPWNPLVSPNLRVSAFQGNGPDMQPVHVLFSNFAIKADRIIRGPEARQVTPPAVPAGTYGLHLDYSKTPGRILTDFNRSNDQMSVYRAEGKGIRIVPPEQPVYKKDAATYWFHDSKFALEGDFEVSMRYQINRINLIGAEGYGSASFSLHFETESPIGSISFSRGLSRDFGHRYGITRHSPTKAGPRYDTQSARANALSGRLIVQRVGAEMIFSAQEGENPLLMEIGRLPFATGPITRFRLATDMGGSCTNAIDMFISDLSVKSGKLVDPESGAPLVTAPVGADPATGDTQTITLDSVPQPASRKWLFLGVGVAVVGVLLLGVFIVMIRGGFSSNR